ncbi:MFS transporter [Actinobaculum suis]|uniref:MFS transporter n=1 Tax=Actinobaculum suis TaxID=1657 RepID=UPI0009E418BD|nr:MFS transporter [Actinobaculum suis]
MTQKTASATKTPDPRLVSSAVSKASKRLIPVLLIMYVIAFIDRTNIGWAQKAWEADAGISTAAYAFGATLFFIGYAVFEVPSNLIMHRVGARWWMTRIMISWGIVAMGFSLVNGVTSYYILRFLLGVTEAGFFPGAIAYMTYWFPAARRGWATGLFYMGLPLANMIGNPLSGGLLEMHGFLNLQGHQWMFIVEGALAVVFGFFVPFLLTDRPKDAKWLTPEERDALTRQIELEEASKEEAEPLHWTKALIHPRIIYFCLIYFCIQASVYGLTFFLPQQVTTFTGQSVGFVASLITAIPWAVALIGVLIIPGLADRTGRYALATGTMLFLSGFGIAISAFNIHNAIPSLIGLSIAAIGFVSAQPIFWQLPTRYLSGAALAGAVGLINAIGNLGGWAAPNLRVWASESVWGTPDAPNETAGLLVLAAAGFIGALLVLGLRLFKASPQEIEAQKIAQSLVDHETPAVETQSSATPTTQFADSQPETAPASPQPGENR